MHYFDNCKTAVFLLQLLLFLGILKGVKRSIIILILLAVVLSLSALGNTAFGSVIASAADDEDDGPRVTQVRGTAVVYPSGGYSSIPIYRGMIFGTGDVISTAENSSVSLTYHGKDITVGELTLLSIDSVWSKHNRDDSSISLIEGMVKNKVKTELGDNSRNVIRTSNIIAGVRGTEYILIYRRMGLEDYGEENPYTRIKVIDGTVRFDLTVEDPDGERSEMTFLVGSDGFTPITEDIKGNQTAGDTVNKDHTIPLKDIDTAILEDLRDNPDVADQFPDLIQDIIDELNRRENEDPKTQPDKPDPELIYSPETIVDPKDPTDPSGDPEDPDPSPTPTPTVEPTSSPTPAPTAGPTPPPTSPPSSPTPPPNTDPTPPPNTDPTPPPNTDPTPQPLIYDAIWDGHATDSGLNGIIEGWDTDSAKIILIKAGAQGILYVPENMEIEIISDGLVENDYQISIDIDDTAKVIWKANYLTDFTMDTIIVSKTGSFEVASGGRIQAEGSTSTAIHANQTTVTINGGSVSSEYGNAISGQLATITVNSGTVSAAQLTAIHGKNNTTITVSGGTVSSSSGGVGNHTIDSDGGIVRVTGGNVELTGNNYYATRAAINARESEVTVSGGTVSVLWLYDCAIRGDSNTIITINGGTVRATGTKGSAILSEDKTTKITINGGTVEATGDDGYAIDVPSGTVDVSFGGTAEKVLNGRIFEDVTLWIKENATVSTSRGITIYGYSSLRFETNSRLIIQRDANLTVVWGWVEGSGIISNFGTVELRSGGYSGNIREVTIYNNGVGTVIDNGVTITAPSMDISATINPGAPP